MLIRTGYNDNLSLETVRRRYGEVCETYDRVKRNYRGIIRGLRKNMRPEDIEDITECIGVLMPLSMQPSVHSEAELHSPNGLMRKITETTFDILLFMTRFKNSGVTRVVSHPNTWDGI